MKKITRLVKFVFSFQFSKLLILLESAIVTYLTYEGVSISKLCILNGFSGSLPWIATMVTAAWSAYGVSVSFYYNKSKSEQLAKIDKTGSEFSVEPGDKPTI